MIRPEPARCPVSGCSADATSTLSTEDHQTLSRVGVEVYSTYCAEHADGVRGAARSVRTSRPPRMCRHRDADGLECQRDATEPVSTDDWRTLNLYGYSGPAVFCPDHAPVMAALAGRCRGGSYCSYYVTSKGQPCGEVASQPITSATWSAVRVTLGRSSTAYCPVHAAALEAYAATWRVAS